MVRIKQYVNLPPGTTNIYGRERQVRVAPDNLNNIGAGDRAEWWLEPVGANNTDIQYIHPGRRPNVAPAVVPLTGTTSSGYFETLISLPHVGGDEYQVKVCKEADHRDPGRTRALGDTFQTWRRLYYTVYHMGNDGLNFFNSLEAKYKSAFERCFLELENARKIPTLTEIARVNANPFTHDFMNGGPNAVIDLAPAGAGTLTDKPFHLALLVVPDCYYTRQQAAAYPAQQNVIDTVSVTYRLHEEPGNPQAFITTGRIRWTGQPWLDVRANITISGSPTAHQSFIRWDFSAVPGLSAFLAANPANSFDLEMELVEEIQVMGYSQNNFCIVRTMDGTTDVLETFTHETGHGVGQVVQQEQRWNAAGNLIAPDNNALWHTDNFGGRGDHCSFNATLSSASPPPGLTSVYVYGGAGNLCTMYYAGEPHVYPDGRFCSSCEPRIKRRNLEQSEMASWNYFG